MKFPPLRRLRFIAVAAGAIGAVGAVILLGAFVFALVAIRVPAVSPDPVGFQALLDRRPDRLGATDKIRAVAQPAGSRVGDSAASSDSAERLPPLPPASGADRSTVITTAALETGDGQSAFSPVGEPFNVLILGVDRVNDFVGNTDVIMLLSADFERPAAALISFPRDLCVGDCSRWTDRLNSVYPRYGAEAMLQMMSELTGQTIDHYVVVNFDGFARIIDRLGGVDIVADRDFNDIVPYPGGNGATLQLSSGPNRLTGPDALMFARSRTYDPTGDFARICRQQQIVVGLLDGLRQPGALLSAPAILLELGNAVETNLSIAGMIELARLAVSIPPESIEREVIQSDAAGAVVIGVDGSYLIRSSEGEIRASVTAVTGPEAGGPSRPQSCDLAHG